MRVSGIFGVHGTNFVKKMLRLARAHKQLRVVADQNICPTAAHDIADAIGV
ncbi:MAG: sugar nucleotide-binding protein [Gammaproteobacteria bacterium]|jgi:dTDP-4-dehydrorhamnose reductase|nr:sugar nucleotide-binding protein [Gammaproteobacteria bacterium]